MKLPYFLILLCFASTGLWGEAVQANQTGIVAADKIAALTQEKQHFKAQLESASEAERERLVRLIGLLEKRIAQLRNPPPVPSTFSVRPFSGSAGGNRYSFKVTADHLRRCPRWDPGVDDQAISVTEAFTRAANKYAELGNPVGADTLSMISLRKLTDGHWCWVVTWERSYHADTGEFTIDRLQIPVLQDGSVPEPTVMPVVDKNSNKKDAMDPPSSAQ